MAQTLNTRLNVQFGTAEDVLGSTFLMEQSARVAPEGEAYFRVHPHSTGVTMISTSGSIFRTSTGLHKRVSRYQTFTGGREISLAYPNALDLRVELVGRFVLKDGTTTTPVLTYDPVRNTLRSDVAGYATLKISYRAPYELWRARFTSTGSSGVATIGDPQTIVLIPGANGSGLTVGSGTPDNDEDPDLSGFRPLTVMGIRDDEVRTVTLTPTPELTELSRYSSYADTGARLPRLQAEVDPDFQPRLTSGGTGALPLKAQARIRLYPAIPASVIVSSGSVRFMFETDALIVTESIAFSGQPSAQLRYQPTGSVGVQLVTSQFVDKWGRRFTPDIVLPGESFQSVRWLDDRTYTNVILREANTDELIVADSLGNAIPAYGVVRVSYPVTYRLYEFTFQYDSDSRRFEDAFFVANYEEQSATLQLTAPSTRGFY